MLWTIIFVIFAAVAIVLILAALRPSTFRVERSATFKAPPERVFAAINNMKAFNEWNPWLRMDPTSAGTYSGPSAGKGAAYAWESKKMGAGRMEIVESQPSSRIGLKLDFLKPFVAHNMAEFTLAPDTGGTRLTWAMHGPQAFMLKVMGLFFNMDKAVGKSFEDGLANMKTIVER